MLPHCGCPPDKRSATIEVVDEQARVLAAGKYGTDKAGYAQMLAAARKFADLYRSNIRLSG